jgi:hypothetical protein
VKVPLSPAFPVQSPPEPATVVVSATPVSVTPGASAMVWPLTAAETWSTIQPTRPPSGEPLV